MKIHLVDELGKYDVAPSEIPLTAGAVSWVVSLRHFPYGGKPFRREVLFDRPPGHISAVQSSAGDWVLV